MSLLIVKLAVLPLSGEVPGSVHDSDDSTETFSRLPDAPPSQSAHFAARKLERTTDADVDPEVN